jgi:hypothetical protein
MLDTVVAIHSILSNTIWLFFLVLGIWGGFRALRSHGVDGNYLGAMVIGEGLYLFQGILGAILWANGLLDGLGRPFMHVLYGAFAVVFLPFVYLVWLKGEDDNRAQWALSFTTLFLFGIALRAIGTGV